MSRLPRVPPDIKGPVREYLIKMSDEIDRELRQRPKKQDGVLYVSEETPLHIVDSAGQRYRVVVDAGALALEAVT